MHRIQRHSDTLYASAEGMQGGRLIEDIKAIKVVKETRDYESLIPLIALIPFISNIMP